MSNVNINWSALGFEYQPIAKRYVANYKDGKWGKGELTDDPNVVLNECAGILQYCQQVFEGLKAYKTKDGRTVTFRPDQNAKRLMTRQNGLKCRRFLKICSWKLSTKSSVPTRIIFLPLKAAVLSICARISLGPTRSSALNRLTNISSASSAHRLALTSKTV